MEKEDLMKLCRYYKGEDNCPFVDERRTPWILERDWFIDAYNYSKTELPNAFLDEIISTYCDAGLTQYEIEDNVPFSLKAYSFYRLSDDPNPPIIQAENFKKYYNKFYKNGGHEASQG